MPVQKSSVQKSSMQKSVFRASARFLLLAAVPVVFAACAADNNPSPMPTGYRYSGRQFVVPSNGPVEQKTYPGEYGQGAAPAGLQPSSGEMATPMASAPVTSSPVLAPAPMMAPMTSSTTSSTATTSTTAAAATDSIGIHAETTPQMKGAASDLLAKTEHDFGRLQDPVYVRDAHEGKADEASFRQALNEVLAQHHYKVAADKKLAPFAFDYSVGSAESGKSPLSLTVLSQGKPILTEKGEYDLNAGAPVAMAAPVSTPAPASAPQSEITASGTPESGAMSASVTPPSAVPPATPVASASAIPPVPSTAPMMSTPEASATDAMASPQPVPVTGPGSAPPPPVAGMTAPSSSPSESAKAGDTPTYVYDGRHTNAPGRTAYEQLEGTNRQVNMVSPADDDAAH